MTAEHLLDPERIVDNLPVELGLRLGILADRPAEEVRINLGLQDFGTASLLGALGLVTFQDYDKSALELAKKPDNQAAADKVQVTDLGGKVMQLCQSRLPEGEEREKLSKTILDITDNRRIIVTNAIVDAPHPAILLATYLDHKKSSAN